MISWAITSLPLPGDHLLGSRTWRLILWLLCCASVQWGGAQQEQGQYAYCCLLLEDLSWKDDMDCPSFHRGRSNVCCALCSTPPSQGGLGSCHMPQNFYLLLHKWPGHIKTRTYPMLIIASIYLLPIKSRTAMFFTLKKHFQCSLQSK